MMQTVSSYLSLLETALFLCSPKAVQDMEMQEYAKLLLGFNPHTGQK